ncbi:MAG: putative baseplate assembly protein, partial [Chloroflexi bacterium]|nr:putative baseplate assembly protein [Chloroflexota bacterium]
MPLDSPRLDDRSFEDIVQEALRRIPLYTPEWTDHNLSDPGITLIELFAWMTDIILYRLNRVPDRHYIKLMELIGMKLREPEAATTRVTFWLSAPQPTDITIQQGTEIATTRTENDPAIVFSSNEPFTIQVARLGHILTSYRPDGGGEREYKEQNLRQAQAGFSGKGFAIFQEKPQPGDAVYFGFKNNLTHHILGLDVVVDRAAGAGIDPTNPPYIWEALASISPVEWARCEIDSDASRAFNVPGLIRLHIPKMVEGQIKDWRVYWVRIRLLKTL